MRSWSRPVIPRVVGRSPIPRIFDSTRSEIVEARPADKAALYVCGITPYDATHLGHAATYLAYDTLIRLWLDSGYEVSYVQNTTDVDDPLLERAERDGVDWRALAEQQTELFRSDMQALSIIPPDHYIAVTEMMAEISAAVVALTDRDIAYRVESDYYFDSSAASRLSPWTLGDESHYDRAEMLVLSAERGGDPERPGKRDALDPLLWRGVRPGEPFWASPLGEGRPGWHIECSVIAAAYLPMPVTVKGGGRDLIFPHHEFSAGHTAALSGDVTGEIYSHTALVAYEGEKMSKSLGNLVFVSALTSSGVDPRAIRLALLAQHYRQDWEYTELLLEAAIGRLEAWSFWAMDATATGDHGVLELRGILANDLDTPGALAYMDAFIASGEHATVELVAAIHALLGVEL